MYNKIREVKTQICDTQRKRMEGSKLKPLFIIGGGSPKTFIFIFNFLSYLHLGTLKAVWQIYSNGTLWRFCWRKEGRTQSFLLRIKEVIGRCSFSEHHFLFCHWLVPYHTHDVGQDGARRADERAHNGQQVVVEQEALCTQRPARVAVQHSDDNRHVSTPDGSRQSHTLGWKPERKSERTQGKEPSDTEQCGSWSFWVSS